LTKLSPKTITPNISDIKKSNKTHSRNMINMKKTNDPYQPVRSILAECLDISESEIRKESRLVEDLGMDSVAALDAMAGIQSLYDIDIERTELLKIRTVQDIISAIQQREAAK
jgi:acyl carrier protein